MFEYLNYVWFAFWDLHSARRVGFDLLPLTMTDVLAWLTIHEISGEERIEIKDHVLAMDRTYLKRYVKKRKKGSDNGGNVQRRNKRVTR